MSVLITLPRSLGFFFGSRAFRMAVLSDRPLMRWAAQSAEISLQLMPHTFSVYVLKKMLKRRLPNWLVTQSWKLAGLRMGSARAFMYERTQRIDSKTPSLSSASAALRG